MPAMDGFETASLIRQRQNTEHTPIIFVTSYPDDTHAARGYSIGAVDYILAPVDPEVLKTKVMVFVELFRKTAQVKHQADALARRAAQLHRLTQASLAINSALSLDQMLQVVSDLALDILNVDQAVAVAAPDQKWSAPRTAVSLSPEWTEDGERPVLRDRTDLLKLLSSTHGIFRCPSPGGPAAWEESLSPEARRRGWLASPLTGRDGRNMGLLHLLGKREGEFTAEDEAVLTQLAQMSSIAIENAMNAEAREANRMKDEFLTTLSHELRTPLSAILGWTRLLRADRRGPRRVMEGLEVIERNVMAQTKLIDDLLDVSRIITGKLRLQVQPDLSAGGHRGGDGLDAAGRRGQGDRAAIRESPGHSERPHLRGSGPPSAGDLESDLELDQVHARAGTRGRDADAAQRRIRDRRPGHGTRHDAGASWLTLSTVSGRPTARPRARTAGWESASRSPATSRSSTAARSAPRATARTSARPSPSSSRASRSASSLSAGRRGSACRRLESPRGSRAPSSGFACCWSKTSGTAGS